MKKVVWIVVFLAGCIEPYTPPEIKPADAILVVDGHIDVNSKSIIKLTRSQNLLETGETEKVEGAEIVLENESGETYPLTEEGSGSYSLPPQMIQPIKHRLVVRTTNKRYVSEFVETKNSPPIDSVSWDITTDLGVKISTSTHSQESDIGYYRWKYEETWIYTATYWSSFVYDDLEKNIDYRTDDIHRCWQSKSSTDIFIASSLRLSENLISKFPLVIMEQRDPRLKFGYSILVKQYAIPEAAYLYWKELEKSTEDLGTLFSPMPSQITGNFTCTTNPEEKVLGYFSIGTSSEKRIFIDIQQLPQPDNYNVPYINCKLDTLQLTDIPTFNSSAYIIIIGIGKGTAITAYLYSTNTCADCRIAGGTNVKPDFWP